jgi:hypothetical protein
VNKPRSLVSTEYNVVKLTSWRESVPLGTDQSLWSFCRIWSLNRLAIILGAPSY